MGLDLSNVGIQILYQSIGIVAAFLCVLSFQFKSNKRFLVFQFFVSVLWSVHFLMANAYAAAIMNAICIFRGLGFYFSKGKASKITLTSILSLAYIGAAVCSCIFFNEKWFIGVICASASIVGTISFAIDNNKIIRWCQLIWVSPCWLFNNVFYLSIGGIICESLNWISALIALIRFYKDDKKKVRN